MPSERVQRQIDRFLDEAEAAMARSDWPLARDRAANALALDPANPDARHYLDAAERALIGTPANGFPLTPGLSLRQAQDGAQGEREPEASEPSPSGQGAALSLSKGQGEGGASTPSPEVPTPPDPTALYRRAFVGRDAELRQLQAAFDGAATGTSGLVMVVGEPGIGKTSVCEQLAAHAGVSGGLALTGHCYEEGSLSLPYLPFIELCLTHISGISGGGLGKVVAAEQVIEVLQTAP